MSKPDNTFTFTSTWKHCLHKNGTFMTAKFWWFKKRYFVCSDCHQSMEEHVYNALVNTDDKEKV